jgi:nitroreductase
LNKTVINAIADTVQDSANYFASWPEVSQMGEMTQRILQRSSFFRDAPAAIAIASSQYQSPMDQVMAVRELTDLRAAEMRRWRNVADTKIQSVSSAIAYLLLVLHQMGLGAVWMTGPVQAKGEIEKILKMPPELDLIAFIPVGYPAENPPLRERKAIKDVCEVIR